MVCIRSVFSIPGYRRSSASEKINSTQKRKLSGGQNPLCHRIFFHFEFGAFPPMSGRVLPSKSSAARSSLPPGFTVRPLSQFFLCFLPAQWLPSFTQNRFIITSQMLLQNAGIYIPEIGLIPKVTTVKVVEPGNKVALQPAHAFPDQKHGS